MKNNTKYIIGGILIVACTVVIFVFFSFSQEADVSPQKIIDDDKLEFFSDEEENILIEMADGEGEFIPSPFVTSWQQYTNKDRSYAISIPENFGVQDEMSNHIDISSSDYDGVNELGIRIQIQKQKPSSNFETVTAYKESIVQSNDSSIDILDLGKFVSVSYYSSDSSDGAFMTYIAFDEKNDVYYNILVFEPGYANNKELIKKIIETFIIL